MAVRPGDWVIDSGKDYFFACSDATFKANYEKVAELVSFSEALLAVKKGKAIQRTGWNGKGMIVKMQFPDDFSKMTLPYLYIEYPADAITTPGAKCPWLASQTDIMAEDWVVL